MNSDQRVFVEKVADMLGEHHPATKFQIQLIARTLGREQVMALLKETLALENAGGVMLPDGSRRRTIGGVFFDLVKKRYGEKLPREVNMYHTYIKLPIRKPQGRRMPARKPYRPARQQTAQKAS